jgi:hypothetical protein
VTITGSGDHVIAELNKINPSLDTEKRDMGRILERDAIAVRFSLNLCVPLPPCP